MLKKILIGLLVILVIIQFIRPSKNISSSPGEADISLVYSMPEEVHDVLKKKCYDCHSNNTHYPWYYNIQPVGWWMAAHVNEGKEHLDFSSFKNYDAKKAAHKIEELSESVNEGWMPLESYLWIHKEAKVEPAEVTAINNWIKSLNLESGK